MKCILCNSELKSNVYHKVRNNPFKKIYKCNKCQMIQLPVDTILMIEMN